MIHRGIGLKLTIVVVPMILLIIGVFAYISISSANKSLLSEVERHAVQIGLSMAASTEYDMLLNEPERVHETVKRLGKQENIERIRLMNKAGEVTYSTDPSEVGRTVDASVESCIRCHDINPPRRQLELKERTRVFHRPQVRARSLGVITPIYNQETCWTAACHEHPKTQSVLGVFDVVLPLDAVDREIRRSGLEVAALAGTAVISLGLLIGILVRRSVTLPVKQLLAATRNVAAGELGKTLDEGRGDELGELARSFNHMTRKLAETRTQLVQSDKLVSLGRLAAGVAHELNNPLTGVLTYSSLLLKGTPGQRELREDLEVIVRETIRCREIVKSLLDFARQTVPKKGEADMNGILTHAMAVVERQLSLNRIALKKEFAGDLPPVVVDVNQMEQVFVNLFVNAADAIGPAGGTITVRSGATSRSPSGTLHIKQAQCPKRHSLISQEVRYDGKAAIRVKARCEGAEGFVFIHPVYGLGAQRQGFRWDGRRHAQFVCPECSSSLMVEGKTCPLCNAPLFMFDVPGKGLLEGCTRNECGWERWDAVDTAGSMPFVEVRVQDTGCGIPPDQLPEIYEPFYSTKGAKGTGLGLAVIWGILDTHDGTIDVESTVNVGTTFTVRIPVKQ